MVPIMFGFKQNALMENVLHLSVLNISKYHNLRLATLFIIIIMW